MMNTYVKSPNKKSIIQIGNKIDITASFHLDGGIRLIQLIYPRHFLLKCLFQARGVVGDVYNVYMCQWYFPLFLSLDVGAVLTVWYMFVYHFIYHYYLHLISMYSRVVDVYSSRNKSLYYHSKYFNVRFPQYFLMY